MSTEATNNTMPLAPKLLLLLVVGLLANVEGAVRTIHAPSATHATPGDSAAETNETPLYFEARADKYVSPHNDPSVYMSPIQYALRRVLQQVGGHPQQQQQQPKPTAPPTYPQ